MVRTIVEDNHIIKSHKQPNNLKQLLIKAKFMSRNKIMSQQSLNVTDQTVASVTLL